MKRFFFITLLAFSFSAVASAQSNKSSQQVSINVAEIAVIAVQGTINMSITTATAGQAPDAVTTNATYALTTNGTDKKISAELDQALPEGLSIFATMSAPSNATSIGKVQLSNNAADLVSGVTQVNESGLQLTYEAVATVNATTENVARTVTYTITNN
jgi:hypothetical protein